jgi:hypothetical protein
MRTYSGSSILYRTVRVLEGASFFSVAALLLVSALFILGNYQEFLDSSLDLLLRVMSGLSLVTIASGACYFAGLVAWMARRRHLMLLRAVYGIVAVAVGAAGSVSTGLLQALTQPI